MEPYVCGFSITNVRSIAEDSTEANATWSVKTKEKCYSDKAIDYEFACEDTLSATEPPVEIEYSEVSLDYCGLPNIEMFKALLAYVEDEIEPMEDATKFTQLFSVLTKLHTNQESVYLNKYIFPSTFVQIIELLYKKLKVLCTISATWNKLPEVFLPTFTHDQRLIIVGVISLHTSDNYNVLKYLIGYSAYGEVFFVSNSFAGFKSIDKLIQFSGILEELQPEQWILYFKQNCLYRTQVKNFKNKVLRLKSTRIENYIIKINRKLQGHFQILSQPILESMLHSNGDICFVDKLIFVCCMLLNMQPRITYY